MQDNPDSDNSDTYQVVLIREHALLAARGKRKSQRACDWEDAIQEASLMYLAQEKLERRCADPREVKKEIGRLYYEIERRRKRMDDRHHRAANSVLLTSVPSHEPKVLASRLVAKVKAEIPASSFDFLWQRADGCAYTELAMSLGISEAYARKKFERIRARARIALSDAAE